MVSKRNPNRLIKIVDNDDASCSVSFTDSNALLWLDASPTSLTRDQAEKLGKLLLSFAREKEWKKDHDS